MVENLERVPVKLRHFPLPVTRRVKPVMTLDKRQRNTLSCRNLAEAGSGVQHAGNPCWQGIWQGIFAALSGSISAAGRPLRTGVRRLLENCGPREIFRDGRE